MSTINNAINNTLQIPFHLGVVSVTTTGTQLNYLNGTSGTTGTGSLVLATSPTLSALTVTGNATANNFAAGTSTKVLIGGSTTLTNTDTQIIIFGGSGGTCILPDATTLVIGWQYYFHNNCSGNVVIEQNGGATLATMVPGSYIDLTALTVAIAAGTWAFSWQIPQNVTWGTAGLVGYAQSGANSDITSLTGLTTPLAPSEGGSNIIWAANSGTSISANTGNGYILTASTATTVTLPTTFAVGAFIGIQGEGASWTLNIGAATNIKSFGNTYTTSFASANNNDLLILIATVANTSWSIFGMITTGFTAS